MREEELTCSLKDERRSPREARRELQEGKLACAKDWNVERLVCSRDEGWSVSLCDKGSPHKDGA